MCLKLFITIICSSTLHVYSGVTFSPAHPISWLHQPRLLPILNALNASCGILASKITGLFLDQYELYHQLHLLAVGNSRYLLPRGCYWQMCHTHYPFYPPVCYFSGNIRTFPNGEIQDNRTCFPLNSTVASNMVRANSACFTSVKEPLYAATMSANKYLARATKRDTCDCHASESFLYNRTKPISAWNDSWKTPGVRSVVMKRMQSSTSSLLQGKNFSV